MSRVTVDAALRSKLLGSAGPTELCDESGQLLGVFTPLSIRQRALLAEPELSDEELQRRLNEPGYSIEQVLDHLRKL